MNVQQLKSAIRAYTAWLKKSRDLPNLHVWEAFQNWQTHWDTDAPDLASVYEQSLHSDTSRRLWNRERFFPKEIMSKLLQSQPDFARRAFQALFDEEKDIENRISLFKFFCDELLKEFKTSKKSSIENNHYHDNNEMVFLYLSFQFPEQYTLFQYPEFRACLEKIGSLNPPSPYDLGRFIKISRALGKWIREDEPCMQAIREKWEPTGFYQPNTLLMVYDFYTWVAQTNTIQST